jgi:hypothetical protein
MCDDGHMSADYDTVQYLSEKFMLGASSLADGKGSIKARLLNAYVDQVMRGGRPSPDLPEALADRINALHTLMQKGTEERGPDGTIVQTIEAMTDDEAAAVAEQIFNIHVDLLIVDRD